jgi:N-acetyl-anhydromuramyl-L-alanine amidase AmpD
MHREVATVSGKPTTKKSRPLRPTAAQVESFAELMHTIVLRFGEIRDTAMAEHQSLLAEWRTARGLATWTEERLEAIETRLARIEAEAGIPPSAEVQTLRATLANYGPAAEALGVTPKPESMLGDAK